MSFVMTAAYRVDCTAAVSLQAKLTATDCQTLLVIFQAVVANPLLVRGNERCQVGL